MIREFTRMGANGILIRVHSRGFADRFFLTQCEGFGGAGGEGDLEELVAGIGVLAGDGDSGDGGEVEVGEARGD